MKWLGTLLALTLAFAPVAEAKRMIMFGFDGLDPNVLQEAIDAGRAPNIQRMAKTGQFAPLGTSIPPQSPVAWSNFITGMDAGGHGIFDFLHRDPHSLLPYLSTSRPSESKKPIEIGKFVIPGGTIDGGAMSSGGYDMLRYNDQTMVLGIPTWWAFAVVVPSLALLALAGVDTALRAWRGQFAVHS